MTKHVVVYWLVIDYSLIIGNNQWLINWLPIDYLLITHWLHWCHWHHRLVISGNKHEVPRHVTRSMIRIALPPWDIFGLAARHAIFPRKIAWQFERMFAQEAVIRICHVRKIKVMMVWKLFKEIFKPQRNNLQFSIHFFSEIQICQARRWQANERKNRVITRYRMWSGMHNSCPGFIDTKQ